MKGTIELARFSSEVLRDNPLGDPHEREFPIYLPPSYHSRDHKHFPVIYYLAGFTGAGKAVVNFNPWKENLAERLDRLIGEGRVNECILVVPDCFTRFGGSQYINSRATGRYEDHLIREVVPMIDRDFRTLAGPAHRAVMGKSSGGYGAVVLGMRHPDIFGHVASHSGDMLFERCYGMDFPKCVNALGKYGGSFAKFVKAFSAAPAHRRGEFPHELVNLAGMASSYCPAARGRGFEIPFDERTGEIIPAVWRRWLAHDPIGLAKRYWSNLKKLNTFFFDCGRKDEFFIHLGARVFSRELARLGVKHIYEEHEKGHFDTGDRYEVSLRLLSKNMSLPSSRRKPRSR